ncbi:MULTISPECIES: DotU family type IV/VI secretion system protein [Sorangium]|uniref:Type IV / VI secretion system DotU domain-containing protein n=1 Tax=Sorangium cellulosum TaxID=56 RepID=A0A4P2QGY7_SORCE|nr:MULTISPECIES: DotU family type IV/VI secretion system protein [Sorangium]AUX29130.1 uncharacterized protein SOCE836_012170 [Sorangium cellulosum]WCQ88521.1 hypothetical protein NQZ70_01199 [Sorangium sp. Soce836]
MTPRLWAELVAAHEDASRLVAAAFADRARAPDLAVLRARLRRRLDELLAALSPPLPEEHAVAALVPLVLLLDELVQGRLARVAAGAPPAWPELQRDLFPDGDGGDAFYEQAAALLRQPDAPPFVIGAYLFCLQAGFQGRLVDDPARIPQWKARLAERLPAAPPPGAEPAPVAFRRARPRSFYALAAIGAVVAWQVVLLALTRAMWWIGG